MSDSAAEWACGVCAVVILSQTPSSACTEYCNWIHLSCADLTKSRVPEKNTKQQNLSFAQYLTDMLRKCTLMFCQNLKHNYL